MPKPYFLRRPSGLYVRFLVPVDQRALIGSRFLLRPLHAPPPLDLARLAAARMAVALSQAFNAMRQGAMVDWRKMLEDAANGGLDTFEWSGSITLLNGAPLSDLRTESLEDSRALLETIDRIGAMRSHSNISELRSGRASAG